MSTRHFLTVGYVPKNCTAERITCGDADASGTREITLIIAEDEISCLENTKIIQTVPQADWFDEGGKIWRDICATFLSDLTGDQEEISPVMMGHCWSIFQNESDENQDIEVLAGPEDFGEFSNEEGVRNGSFFVRYQLEEDDEYFNETVLGFFPKGP